MLSVLQSALKSYVNFNCIQFLKGGCMQKFAGSYKKSIAGIGCALSIFLLAQFSFANEPLVLADNQALATAIAATSASPNSESTQPAAVAPVATAKPISTPVKTNSASQLASLIGGLVLILVLIYGLSWFVKRFSQGGFLHNPTMKIVSAMPLGTRERLMLVEVGGKQLLLGVTATQINTLHIFDEPVTHSEKTPPVASDFSQKLMAILQQKNITPVDDSAHKKFNS
jgi:flagellar protein FliO/FliZ